MRKILIILSIFTGVCASSAHAVMILTLSGSSNSSVVSFEVSGSSIFTAPTQNFTDVVFDITGGADPFPAAIRNVDPFGRFPVASGSATLSNDTTAVTVAAPRVALQDAALFGVARFGIGTDIPILKNPGDVFSWIGAGTFDLVGTGLTFGDLQAGIYDGFAGYAGFDGRLVIAAAVPEPGTLALLIGGLLGLGLRKRS